MLSVPREGSLKGRMEVEGRKIPSGGEPDKDAEALVVDEEKVASLA